MGPRDLRSADTVLRIQPQVLQLAGVGFISFAPFRAPPLESIHPDGEGLAVADWTTGTPSQVSVRSLDALGRVRWQRTLPMAAAPVSRRTRDSLLAIGVTKASPHVERERARQGAAVVPTTELLVERGLWIPSHYPPVQRIVQDRSGRVWLELQAQRAGRLWLVLSPNGTPAFEVILPHEFRLHQAAGDTLWGTSTDEDDVIVVVRRDIVRR
jgi:hypothetical protein